MADDRLRPLNALTGVDEGLLIGALREAKALMPDRQARVVHHREHAAQALILLAEQEADGTVAVAIGHDAGRARR